MTSFYATHVRKKINKLNQINVSSYPPTTTIEDIRASKIRLKFHGVNITNNRRNIFGSTKTLNIPYPDTYFNYHCTGRVK